MYGKTRYISQVTIVCPKTKSHHTSSPYYYNKNKWENLFGNTCRHVKLVYIDYVGDNNHASYDQWIQAYLKFPDFEYYIFMEDDYCVHPSIFDFDHQLVEFYNKKVSESNNIGYLCTFSEFGHASISNGIINKKTMNFINRNEDILENFYIKSNNTEAQIGFSNMFTQNKSGYVPIYSMHEDFLALFWSSFRKQIELFSSQHVNKYMFIPLQFITKEKF